MARSIMRKGDGAETGRGTKADAGEVVRWQMDTIGEPRATPRATEATPEVRPPEEELARIREVARAQGHAEGLAAGRAAGAREMAELGQLLGRLREVMDGFEQQLAGDMLGLALEIARQIMRHTIHVHPEVVLPVIREAIASLPQGSLHPRLILHPDDALLVRSVLDANQLTPAPWRIVEDAKLERGGCRVETAASELDATVESRWKAVIANLGREDAWVDLEVPARSSASTPSRESR
ncbi:MAG: flagellar assembly protein FliH [Proteobacteria bacterium]|nr:flagellar assembly protein FliH [Burkholderiales bacterium]